VAMAERGDFSFDSKKKLKENTRKCKLHRNRFLFSINPNLGCDNVAQETPTRTLRFSTQPRRLGCFKTKTVESLLVFFADP
ncbi:hypothetical protein BaRGS_00007746, partial [Batillaria attramentaria]